MKYILIPICLVGQASYIYFNTKKKNNIALLSKTIASICFVCFAYFNSAISFNQFNVLIIIGMILDAIGDIFLGLRNLVAEKKMFYIGALSFMIGHVFYIFALMPFVKPLIIYALIASIVLDYFVVRFIKSLCTITKTQNVIAYIYLFLIFTILTFSVCAYINNINSMYLLFMIGSLLYACSDVLLIIYNYAIKNKWLHPLYSCLYYVGQLLIAFSLML